MIRPLLASGAIKGMAHITGGGITENLPRILPAKTQAVIDRSAWRVPPIFEWLQQAGDVPSGDMLRTFNMGIGLILAVAANDAFSVLNDLRAGGETGAATIGVRPHRRRRRRLFLMSADASNLSRGPDASNRTIGVLISGRGSNLQALIDAVADGQLDARIAIVISNRASAAGLARAAGAGIETLVVDHRSFPSRDEFDRAVAQEL